MLLLLSLLFVVVVRMKHVVVSIKEFVMFCLFLRMTDIIIFVRLKQVALFVVLRMKQVVVVVVVCVVMVCFFFCVDVRRSRRGRRVR